VFDERRVKSTPGVASCSPIILSVLPSTDGYKTFSAGSKIRCQALVSIPPIRVQIPALALYGRLINVERLYGVGRYGHRRTYRNGRWTGGIDQQQTVILVDALEVQLPVHRFTTRGQRKDLADFFLRRRQRNQ